MASWRLKRTSQCPKCPWIVGVDPRQLPNGYSEARHRALAATIAKPAELAGIGQPVQVMACHETGAAHCVGWLNHQLGVGNNISLRLQMLSCENIGELRLRGEQHPSLEATFPPEMSPSPATEEP